MPMNKEEYRLYLESDYWQLMKRLAHEANPGGGCRMCGTMHDLEVHHRTYVRCPYNELLSDLTVVCDECHEIYESAKKAKARQIVDNTFPVTPVTQLVPAPSRLQALLDTMLKKPYPNIVELPDGRRFDTVKQCYVKDE
jgi:hypothetical protein